MTENTPDPRWLRRPRNIAFVGEAMVELSLDASGETARVGVAGDTLNAAVYLRRNWPGQVAYVTALGQDAMSDRIAGFIAGESISTDLIARSAEHMPGLYSITTDAAGERSFSYWRSASAARSMFQDDVGPDIAGLAQFDAVALSAITLAILPHEMRSHLLDKLEAWRQAQGGLVIFDSNYRPRLWQDRAEAQAAIEAAWAITDIGLPSVDDEQAIFGDADAAGVLKRLNRLGVTLGALKRGEAGPLPLDGSEIAQTYPPAANVVDTTAAGDSFNGGFLARWAGGGTLAEALLAGHSCASQVVGLRGAFG